MDWTEINGFSFHLKKKANFMPWYYSFSLLKKNKKREKNQCDANDAVKINQDVG